MYPIATRQEQKKKSLWVNKKQILVIHHSGWTTYESFLNTYENPENIWSYHYVIDEFGNVHKFGYESDIVWHAWFSGWGKNHPNNGKNSLNPYAISICIIWPLKEWGFNEAQREAAVGLSMEIISRWNIDPSNLARHIDITQYDKSQIANKRYYAWWWKCRKVDIDPKTRDWNKFLKEVLKK